MGGAVKNFISAISSFKRIITVEDHVLEGGFGSYVLEVIARNNLNIRVVPIAFQYQIVGMVAKEDTMLKSLLSDLFSCIVAMIEA